MGIFEQPEDSLTKPIEPAKSVWQIGDCLVIPDCNEIRQNAKTHKVEAKAMDVLVYLAEHADQTVSVKQLLDARWNAVSVSDNTVRRIIAQLRKTLNDDVNHPSYIATIPRKGYRLIAKVSQKKVQTNYASLNEVSQTTSKIKKSSIFTWSISLILTSIVFTIYGYKVFYQQTDRKIFPAVTKIKAFTSLPGRELAPTISPDGKHVIFVHAQDNNYQYQLRIQSLSQSHSQELRNGMGNPFSPSWSPNGKYLAYADMENCRVILAELSVDLRSLVNQKIIHQCNQYILPQLAWSLDSQSFFFNDIRANSKSFVQFEYQLTTEEIKEVLFNKNEKAKSIFKLLPHPTKSLWAVVSPKAGNQAEIWFFTPESKAMKLVHTSETFTHFVNWCGPTEPYLLINDNRKLIKVDVHGVSRMLANSTQIEYAYLTCSRVSDEMIFASRRQNTSLIWQQNPKILNDSITTSNTDFIFRSTSSERNAVWSNQNQKLAFVSDRTGRWKIWVGTQNNTYPIITNQFDAPPYIYGWSKDDRKLLLLYRKNLISLELDTGRQTLLSQEEDNVSYAAWSNDGQSVYFNSTKNNEQSNKTQSQIFKLNTLTKAREQITFKGGLDMAEAPNQEKLYFTRPLNEGIWEIDLVSRKQKLLTKLIPSESTFQVFSDGIYFHHHNYELAALSFYNFQTQSVETVLDDSGDNGHGFSISSDQSKIVYLSWDEYQADLKRVRLHQQ